MTAAVPSITIGQGLLPLLTNRDPFVLVEGRRGTGKTRGILSILMCWALEFPGTRIMLARSTRTRLSQSVLVTFEKQVFPAFGLDVPGGAGRENRSEYVLSNGSVFVPLGLDDQQRSQSAEFAWIYVAEGVEIPVLDDVAALAGTMRQAKAPWHQCIVDCNPGPPAHWLNQKAEPVDAKLRRVTDRASYNLLQRHNRAPAADPKSRWKRLVTCHQDNPGYFDVDRWRWKKLGEQYLETLSGLTGPLRRRWLDGDWVAAEGSVYPEFDEDQHVMTPFRIPPTWPVYSGFDPGFDHPMAWLWFTVAPNETLYIIDELVGTGIDLPQLAKAVKDRHATNRWIPTRCYGDPQYIFAKRQESEPTASQMKKLGVPLAGWPRTGGNMDAMVSAVRQRLINRTLKVFRTCSKTIEAFQSWQFARTAHGEVPATDADKYEQAYKDPMDVVRGVVATKPTHKGIRVQVVG